MDQSFAKLFQFFNKPIPFLASWAHHHLDILFPQIHSHPFISQIILLPLIFLRLVSSGHLDGFDLILNALDKFLLPVEMFVVLLVQKDYIVAWILLELLVDQHSVDEESCIAQFFAVGSIHYVQDCVEAGQLAHYLLFWDVVAQEVV